MNPGLTLQEIRPLSLPKMLIFILVAIAAFTLAYSFSSLSFLMVVYLHCLLALARLGTAHRAFYAGLAVGMLGYSFQLACFYTIFGPAAVALWFVLAFWLGLFVMLARLSFLNFRPVLAAVLIPFLWTGLEYFRSELYYLRFSWLNVGYAFSDAAYCIPLKLLGNYGLGFLLMASVSGISLLRKWHKPTATVLWLPALAMISNQQLPLGQLPQRETIHIVRVAGVQLEFEGNSEIMAALDRLVQKCPKAELLVLSEYALGGPPPDEMTNWCREHHRFLIVGGKDSTPDGNFYDTAFVISTNGEVVFKQAKAVPIQFFKDGLPAPEQKLWDSPWGKIGLCICYDLSYTRVTDQLIRLGAQAIIVPTMDVEGWGRRQHELHARVAPIRAAEYGVHIFRVASSGISQWVHPSGKVLASAPFPGQGEMLNGALEFHKPGTLPFDRVLAPICVAVTTIVIAGLTLILIKQRFSTSKV